MMWQHWCIQMVPGIIRGIPGAQGAVGTSIGNIIHGKYTTGEPLPYWELLNMDQVLQPQVKVF